MMTIIMTSWSLFLLFTLPSLIYAAPKQAIVEEGSEEFKEFRKYYMDRGKQTTHSNQPQFDEGQMSRSVSVPLDDPVYLHCKVKNQGNFKVAWIRQTDNHILAVGNDVFTQDNRFQISPVENNEMNDWTLIIRYARKSDSGSYECQLSTDPPRTVVINLNVIEKPTIASTTDVSEHKAELQGPAHVGIDQDFTLYCKVFPNQNEGIHVLENVAWSLNGSLIDLENKEKYEKSKLTRDNAVIHLLKVRKATLKDSGNYQCKPSNTPPQTVPVYVGTPRQPSEKVVQRNTYGPPSPTTPIPTPNFDNGGTGSWRKSANWWFLTAIVVACIIT